LQSSPQAKTAPKPRAQDNTAAELSPQIAQRAYQLYEEGGRQDGTAVKNWEKAESEIRMDSAKTGSALEAKVEPCL
jgi:hypothetical protein